MTNEVDKAQFLSLVQDYTKQLSLTKNFDQAHELWRRTNIPYVYTSQDPLSAEYGREVLELYRNLTQTDYAAANEMTSTKQSQDEFEVGFPWISYNLEAVAQEYAKVTQALRAIHQQKSGRNQIIEFGSGWGNLSIPLAKSGQDVTVVDIDDGFLERLQRIAAREGVHVQCLLGDFVEIAKAVPDRYDFAVFQASFHHCLNFIELVESIRDQVLKPDGCLLFLCEPIIDGYPFPWGLRFDGESLWAITQNKWLELGFDREFFTAFMHRSGFLVSKVPAVQGFVGEGWMAQSGPEGVPFEEWMFSDEFSRTFHSSQGGSGHGRFCREISRLPGLKGCFYSTYAITFRNYGRDPLAVRITTPEESISFSIEVGAEHEIACRANCDYVEIVSEVFCPHTLGLSGDTRVMGPAITRVAFSF